ncbi:hypothetical protein CMO93_03100 [Candidatus Woesearchaeota archaeon]|nr:hypothetical protein [Candidatus Woesearchaeota archaeon]|tara:strand:- start:223 stop:762 length:540 start_codon:yes stop_codon:yes gene_type:complete
MISIKPFKLKKENQDRSLIQKKPNNNIDLDKRQFVKSGFLGILTGVGIGLLSRIPFVEAAGIIDGAELKSYSETTIKENAGATYTIDFERGNVFELTLIDNCTFTFLKPPISGKTGSFTLILVQDSTGSRTATWPAAVDWEGGSQPTLSTAANAVDVFIFFTTDGGRRWYGFLAGINLK